MPTKLCTLLLTLLGCTLLSAQEKVLDLPDPALAPRPQVIILSGVAQERSEDAFQTCFISAEHPVGPYQNVGVQYTSYLSLSNYSYTVFLHKGGYEIGVFGKFFLHGRLSGRRSHLYYGPQLRFGVRNMSFNDLYPIDQRFEYQMKITKVLFGIGGQYTLGHAVFGWALPFGIEYGRLPAKIAPFKYYGSDKTHSFTIIPAISMGFQL